ncbi:MAG: CBS domain-containing protein [Armatimonadia bacterium]|nr:CBS domain-containing protein [Armatimonadia bacterium]
MDVIVGHYGTDFDCLASMVAAKKLYPRAQCVLPGRVDRNVRGFLDLYEDQFEILKAKDISADEVRRVIIVDTQRGQRLGEVLGEVVDREDVHVVVYDHHPSSPDDVPADESYIQTLGATTTILTGIIRDEGIHLTPVEATLLALGIYEDTGSLSFSSTTVDDVLCVAYLLECGADLDVVSRHIRYDLTEEQRAVLNQFILSVEHTTHAGVTVAIAQAKVDDYVGDVAVLTHKLAVIESVDALFTITEASGSIYVVGRSRSSGLDVAEVLAYLGGGGHHRAASAVIKDSTVEDVHRRLSAHVAECVHPPLIARDLMSHPVRMVEETTSVDEAKKVLLRYGYSGILVARQGQLVGIVNRKDLDKAIHHGLGHAPVKSCMTTGVVFATPDTPAPEIQQLLVNHRVGRVPVIDEEGTIVGIVTMADLRAGTHRLSGNEHRMYHGEWCGVQDVSNTVRARQQDNVADLLRKLGRIADEMGIPAFLVGGGARDLLLGEDSLDVDILVEGNAIEFATVAARRIGARLITHEKFVTAVMVLDDEQKIDVASARTEFYEAPAALPQVEVEHSSVKEDLYRRDFTINAMAIQINESAFGRLYDFFGGRADLERGIIRVMHSLSFVEDPTRIFRAVRFEQRLGFAMDMQTEQALAYALESELFSALTSERIRDEIVLILSEKDPIPAVHRMSHLGLWEHVHPRITFDNQALDEMKRTKRVLKWLADLDEPVEPTPWLMYFSPLLREMTHQEVRDCARRLRMTREDIEDLAVASEAVELVLPAIESPEPASPSQIYRRLESLTPLGLARILVLCKPGGVGEDRISEYLQEYRHVSLRVGGEDLKRMGYEPGPGFGRVLRELLVDRLDGIIEPADEPTRLREIAERVYSASAEGMRAGTD